MNMQNCNQIRGALNVCPLCGRILATWRLHKHIQAEHWKTRKEIIVEIKSEHPDWCEESGACKRCWESFRGIVRVVRFMRKFRFPKNWPLAATTQE